MGVNDVPLLETTRDQSVLADSDSQTFRATLLGPDDPAYDEVRKLYNGMIEKRPLLIARSGLATGGQSYADC